MARDRGDDADDREYDDPRYERDEPEYVDPGDESERVTEVRRRRPPPPWWRERWWIWGLVLLLLVGALIAFFALRDTTEEGMSGRATVPNVIGLQEDDAVDRVEAEGLDADVQRVTSTRPEGTVLRQDPNAGTELEEGDRVLVVAAAPPETVTETVTQTQTQTVAPETVDVPDVVGEDHVAAGAEVDEAGLVANTYPVPSEEVRGTVIAQNPDAGSELPEGSPVRLNVALGPGSRGTFSVPDLTGAEEADARDRCRSARFTCRTVDRAASSDDDVGKVLDQSPTAGTQAAQLSQITIFVGRG